MAVQTKKKNPLVTIIFIVILSIAGYFIYQTMSDNQSTSFDKMGASFSGVSGTNDKDTGEAPMPGELKWRDSFSN